MSDQEKIQFVQSLLPDMNISEALIKTYLSIAASRITERLYPFGNAPTAWNTAYDIMQCELTVRMIARMGGEGEISHSENGVSRTYASVDDEDILSRLTPFVGVI